MKCTPYLEQIAARIAAMDPAAERKVPGVFQYKIKADDGIHTHFLDLINLKTGQTTSEPIDVTFNIGDEDFVLIHTKKMTYHEAISSGKATVVRNMELAEKLIAAS